MHGLTGGSWKRSHDRATATEMNNPTGNRAVPMALRPTADQGHRASSRPSTGCLRARYFPPPVRAVEIPKPHGGGTRMLGIPTVADRVAQTVVAVELEKKVEPIFHDDSYGYRPGRSALDAVGICRQRCWKTDWVIDLDIQKFFDSVSWDLMLKAVAATHRFCRG